MIKNFVSFTGLFLLLILTFSKIIYPEQSSCIIWEKTFDNNGNADAGSSIVEDPEQNIIAVGGTGPTHFTFDYNSYGIVIKTDKNGNIIWKKQFGGKGINVFSCVITKGTHYIIAGSKTVQSLTRQAWLIELDKDGNVLTEKTFGKKFDDGFAQIISTSDNGYLAVGQIQLAANKKSDVWLAKFDENFNIIWDRSLDLGNQDTGMSIAKIGEKNFIVVANTITKNYGNLFQQGYSTFIIIDSNGNILKQQTFKNGPKNKFSKVKSTNDGGAIIVGQTSIKEKFPSEDTWVIKLDKNANIEWTRIFESYGRYDGGFDIVQTDDDGYIITAYSQVHQTERMNFDNFWIFKTDKKGDIIWQYTWGGPDNDDAVAITKTIDGNYLITGSFGSVSWPLNKVPGQCDLYIAKIKDIQISPPAPH